MNKKTKVFCEKKAKNFQYYNLLESRHLSTLFTLLLAPNGCGKTTTIKHIISKLKDKDVTILRYSTSLDDIVDKGTPAFGNWDINKLACAWHSEGERMIDSFSCWFCDEVIPILLSYRDNKELIKPLYIFIDEADSGLSPDTIYTSFTQMINILLDSYQYNENIHVLITANSYELARLFNFSKENEDKVNIYWLPSRNKITITSFDRFDKMYQEYRIYLKQLENDNN